MKNLEPASKVNTSINENKGAADFIKKHPVLVALLTGLLAAIAVYLWKDFQKSKQLGALEKAASEQLIQSNNEMLTVLSRPLIWSIRSEMLGGNLEQVNIYVKDIVKEKNFQILQIIDANGKIILSTNKKLEGKNANQYYDSTMLNTTAIKIKNTENTLLVMTAPIMGYDKKLGVLIIEYKPTPFTPALSVSHK